MRKCYKVWLIVGGLVSILILVGLYHVSKTTYEYQNAGGFNPKGRAIAYAAELAFGQFPDFPERAVFKSWAEPLLLAACAERTKSNDDAYGCRIVSYAAYQTQSLHEYCSFIRRENCTLISANPIFQKDQRLKQALSKVIKKPCEYLPSKEEIEASASGDNKDEFLRYRRDLGCENSGNIPVKIIVTYDQQPNLEALIIQSNWSKSPWLKQ